MSGSGKMAVKMTATQRDENKRPPGGGRYVVVAGYDSIVRSKNVAIAMDAT